MFGPKQSLSPVSSKQVLDNTNYFFEHYDSDKVDEMIALSPISRYKSENDIIITYYDTLYELESVDDVKSYTDKFNDAILGSQINDESKDYLLSHTSIAVNSYELWFIILKEIVNNTNKL